MRTLRQASPRDAPSWPEYFEQRAAACRSPLLSRYFSSGTAAPTTPVGDVEMVALDLETTGLDPRRHAVVSVGAVPFTLDRIRLAERCYWVVQPTRPLSSKSVTLHRITHSEIAEAPDLERILPELFEVMAGRLVVVHFRHIERPFLDGAVKERLGEGIRFPVIDTMSLEARRHRLSLWARFRRWLRRPPVSIRLHDSRLRYGLPAYQGHHALLDALATAELLQAQIATHYRLETPVGELWS
ncbi:3'-5' exonuclease [Halomonas sp. NO4]|uniref:3'-5' exonuclease n=1 Tax=Halomonas sp. NO4 TaxID=2484813 RepID=UPI0013D55CBE|nr:3'-5' exonuclease [Halomonas sp. NO4]